MTRLSDFLDQEMRRASREAGIGEAYLKKVSYLIAMFAWQRTHRQVLLYCLRQDEWEDREGELML